MSDLRARHRVGLAILLLVASGCASFEGARLYRSGTDALDHGRPELAIERLERAAQLLPDASEIQNHLGLAYAQAGRREDARTAFRRALALDCDNEAARFNLAIADREGREAITESTR